jgi:long-chain acyl-CoA synthetase
VALVEVRIADTDDREVARGTVGEVQVRGPNVMLGYWNRPEQTAAALGGGWYHAGDGGYMDEQGLVHIVGRLKDMIISGDENIYSAEVENAIATLNGVREVAVIGIPDERWGETVHAVVVPREGVVLTAEQLIAHCRTRIAGYKCPRSIEIRAEPLPLSGAGKVLKTLLREPFWRGRERRVG